MTVTPRRSVPVLIAYGLPSLPLAAMLLPLYIYLPTFYVEERGLGLAAVGTVLLLARIWDLVTDPAVGFLSDRIRTRIGRRRPWLMVGAPLLVACAWPLFNPPEGIGPAWLLGWSLAFYLAATMILLPYSAWGAELADDYHERSRVTAWRETFTVVGTLAAASLPAILGGGTGPTLTAIAIGLTVLMPLTVFIACVGVPEPPRVERVAHIGFKRGLKVLLGNRPAARLVAAYLLNGLGNAVPATIFLLFVGNVLQASDWAGPLLVIYFACGMAAIPLWLKLSKRYGKHRVWSGAMLFACAVFFFVPFLGPGDVAIFAAICVLSGAAIGADLILPPSIQADVIDIDRAATGQERAGLYFGIWAIATKLATALAVGLAFPLLDLSGFDATADNTQGALFTLAALYAWAPVAFKLAAVSLMMRFELTRPGREALAEQAP